MGEGNSGEEKTGTEQRGSDYQRRRVAPMVFALQDGEDGERRRERRESSAKTVDDDFSNMEVHGARELVCDKTRNSTTNRVRGHGRPRPIRGVVPTHKVFAEITHHAAEGTEQGGEKKSHR